MSDAHAHADDGKVHAHISAAWFLGAIFCALIVLTVLTVAVSYVDLGSANTVVAIAVATVKASLVATFFMHLRHDKPFHALVFVMSFVFLGIFLTYTMNDLGTRGAVDRMNGGQHYLRHAERAPGGLRDEDYVPPATPLPSHGEHGGGHQAPAAEHH
jgi:cytochrome c oxidase subunit 4